MENFNIGTQIRNELEDFKKTSYKLAQTEIQSDGSVRTLDKQKGWYDFNQRRTLAIIDLYFNSEFETGPYDENGKRKMFMNIGKFRSEVSSKQIKIKRKHFRFIPDDYADPWVAFFMQKDFTEYAKESRFSEVIEQCVDAFPKYGTVVLKKLGKEIVFVPLQNLRNEQRAKSLKTADYVIEEHPDMHIWEMQEMPNWDTEGLNLRMDETMTVFERYGRVPLKWLKKQNNVTVSDGDDKRYVDALVIAGFTSNNMKNKDGVHTFFAEELKEGERPYEEAHWARTFGRWLGVGVMEDLVENQKAKNIAVNLIRRSMQWSAKRMFQTQSGDDVAKNLVRDVPDGALLEVGANGEIKEIPFQSKYNSDSSAFLNEFEKNSDQKAFTFEVATGESLPSNTPFRLGVLLSTAVNSFFEGKRDKLGLLLKNAINEFEVPRFIKDMDNEDRVLTMFSDEPGYEALKDASMDLVRSEACRISFFTGKSVDADSLVAAVDPYESVRSLMFNLPKGYYKNANAKFELSVTGEEIDIAAKLETLKTLWQVLDAKGDKRAEKVLERIAAISGENLAVFGPAGVAAPAPQTQQLPAKSPAPAAV